MSNFAVMHALPRIADQSQSDGLFTESLMAAVAESTPEAQVRLRAFLEGKRGQGGEVVSAAAAHTEVPRRAGRRLLEATVEQRADGSTRAALDRAAALASPRG